MFDYDKVRNNSSNVAGPLDFLMNRFTQALNSPIHSRCAELTVLIDRCSSKDLQHFFPTFMESIFGTSGGTCWGLRTITQTKNFQDFESLHHFLGPLGPVFRLIYKLLNETQAKYEFSIMHVPNKIRQVLEHGKVPPFYSDLTNFDPQTRKLLSLSLNAFDFYMFHFAYHLVNPWQQRNLEIWSTWNTVYYILCCEYLIHFVPTDPNAVILPRLTNYTGKNPVIVQPQSVVNRPQRNSKLLRSHLLQSPTSDITSLHPSSQQHPRGEIWRSETVIHVFIDLWLNNEQLSMTDNSPIPQLKVNELPSGEYIRTIRVMVKQLHSFSATAQNDTTPLGELKSIVEPMLQGKMYAFLRHLVYKWPLDGSFKLVLELWLSFIQPWRYTGKINIRPSRLSSIMDTSSPLVRYIRVLLQCTMNKTSSTSTNVFICSETENDDQNLKTVDSKYIDFIAENLLAYTVIFQQLLPRFSRIDLSSPKNAHMLYRVAKVFGQPNLVQMIQEVESCVSTLNHSPTHHSYGTQSTTLPPLSPTSCWSTNTPVVQDSSNFDHSDFIMKSANNLDETNPRFMNRWSVVVRHRIYELEGPEFCYKPLFATKAAPEVYQLLRHIETSEYIANENIKQQVAQVEQQSVLHTVLKLLFSSDDLTADEFTLEERRKVILYLRFAKSNLNEMFQLTPNITADVNDNHDSSFHSTTAEWDTSQNGIDLSPASVRQRARRIKYEGDPDLHPVRSTENKFLVGLLYQLSQRLNTMYADEMRIAYYRGDFAGKLARQILSPPLMTYYYDKSVGGRSPRVEKLLPPRVSLRYFASHRFLAYFFIGILLAKFCGYSTIPYIFFLILLWIFYIVTRALFCHENLYTTTQPRRLTFSNTPF